MGKIKSIRAVLDACVLYPAPVRDVLLSFAGEEMYQPKWTEEIQQEWIRNLLKNRSDLRDGQLRTLVKAMDEAFPDAHVLGYHGWIDKIKIPDKNDRHVVAAAMESNSDRIITFNLKDFPESQISGLGLISQHPDDFLVELIKTDEKSGIMAIDKQLSRLKNPPIDKGQLLHIFNNVGLPKLSAVFENVR